MSRGTLVATSLDSNMEVTHKYAGAGARLARLRSAGCEVIHEVDATLLNKGPLRGSALFDRIVFNFPLLPKDFAAKIVAQGAHVDCILENRAMLVSFLEAAPSLLASAGLVVIASKNCRPYSWWRIEALPLWTGGELSLAGVLPWENTEYPSLMSGPCNVDCDLPVKPTDAVVFVFSRAEGKKNLFGAPWCREFARIHGSAPFDTRLVCAFCRPGGIHFRTEEELAEHNNARLHQKRLALEERWNVRLKMSEACSHAIGVEE